MTVAALELSDLHKSFDGTPIIRALHLTVVRGTRHAVIGPNGAGKSTMFNLISGLHAPSSGQIRLQGSPIGGEKPHAIVRRGLARSFQITNIFPRLTVFENVRFGIMARQGWRFTWYRPIGSMRALNHATGALLDEVGLSAAGDRLAGDLAYSDQRSLEIAMTLSTGAAVILLDEPTAGMSAEETTRFVAMIRRVTEGRTLLMVEHDMTVVFSLCDTISVLVYGQVVATGTPAEIRANAKVQQAYLGDHDVPASGGPAC